MSEIIIYCPICNKKVAKFSKHQISPVVTCCMKCGKRIKYYIEDGRLEVTKMKKRDTSSGMTFV